MILQSVTLKEPYRSFPKGFTVDFKNRVTVVVGDNGAGKSTLLGLIRSQFKSTWTPSSLTNAAESAAVVHPEPASGEQINAIDLAADHMGFRGDMDEANFDVHLKVLQKSAGQASIIQLSDIMQRSKARLHIIDEPERGLSPAKEWVLAALLKEIVSERPDDQFIVSTHSDKVMEALGGCVLQLPNGVYLNYKDYLDASHNYGQLQADRYVQARKAEREQNTYGL
ncbi:AAA family ATPase [Sulfitobacter sp. R18_1]|uniref:AAA family ATPase n=1 Tax=Sulfitobacter sp. R18_1 TaxID=2821104 RepID=UPI001ADA1605|nr:AAA family ATPase [Sulfitobacter sp. R18_1]MBO9427969.1 AAA family ATPase [Sulfitobacter sp. R18_1]